MATQYLNNIVLDRGLEVLVADTTRLLLCSSEDGQVAITFEDVIVQMLGDVVPVITGPADTEGGRCVTCAPIDNGIVHSAGLAAFWALIDDDRQRLLAAALLETPLNVEPTNSFTLESFLVRVFGVCTEEG